MENKLGLDKSPIESNDPRVAAEYLRGLKSSEDIVRQGLKWMEDMDKPVHNAGDVPAIILNNTKDILKELDSLRNKQSNP